MGQDGGLDGKTEVQLYFFCSAQGRCLAGWGEGNAFFNLSSLATLLLEWAGQSNALPLLLIPLPTENMTLPRDCATGKLNTLGCNLSNASLPALFHVEIIFGQGVAHT